MYVLFKETRNFTVDSEFGQISCLRPWKMQVKMLVKVESGLSCFDSWISLDIYLFQVKSSITCYIVSIALDALEMKIIHKHPIEKDKASLNLSRFFTSWPSSQALPISILLDIHSIRWLFSLSQCLVCFVFLDVNINIEICKIKYITYIIIEG